MPRTNPGRLSLDGLMEACVALCALASVMGWLGRFLWVFDLASHFIVQEASLLALLGVALLVRRRWRWAAAALVLSVVHVATFAPAWFGRPAPPPADAPALRVVSLNVFIKSQSYADVAAMLSGEKADVVALVEVNQRWADALSPLVARWPHVVSEPREHSFGMMVLSRVPILESSVQDLSGTGRVTLRLTLDAPGGPVTLFVFHPPPPVTPDRAARRDAEMRLLAAEIRGTQGPVLAVGDFNCTPWSPHMRDLVHGSGLLDTRKGFGILPTWPSPLLPLMIPIDQALVSRDLGVVDLHVGPRVGSDHAPLVVVVARNAH